MGGAIGSALFDEELVCLYVRVTFSRPGGKARVLGNRSVGWTCCKRVHVYWSMCRITYALVLHLSSLSKSR